MSGKPFFIDYDKRGAAKCKKCKEKLEKGMLRIARVGANPFSDDGGDFKTWFHLDCLIESFKRARATTKKIDDPSDDIEGWEDISKEDQQEVKRKVKDFHENNSKAVNTKKAATPKKDTKKKAAGNKKDDSSNIPSKADHTISLPKGGPSKPGKSSKDDLFKEFRKLCAKIADESSYLEKTNIVSEFFEKGSDGDGFKGDLRLWVHLLLPGVVKRVYNLQSKQLTKVFSEIFNVSQEEMLEDLEKGDIAETVRVYFESSKYLPPVKKSVLTLQEVDSFLEELEGQTTEEAQASILKRAAQKSTGNDLKMIVRLIKGDLRINAGAKHILEGLHPDAYEAFRTTRNIDTVIDEILKNKNSPKEGSLKIQAKIMTPVLPMLAQACRSVEQAMEKCPNGIYAEIKYDGERVQVHKKGTEFKYFSRSLKPVMPHKVSHFKDYIPSAFPHGSDLILDSEILLIDTNTSLPLPFGTLGKHKKGEIQDANVCLFVFDCIHYNGVNLLDRPIKERRKILEKNMVVVKNHVVLSEMKEIHKPEELRKMIQSVIKQGLEGLVLKDINSIYEPGKRHWLKVKKDYLQDGAMADSADLVVLGAFYGTGKKGGMMSIFLMGCYDPFSKKWCTVTKVSTGHDDAALDRLQTELKMDKISQNYDALPSWIKCSKQLAPDFIAKDPKKSPVWEITGAEFTKTNVHTADGISIRFPRVTKERSDKDWTQATDLPHLKELYKISKEHTDFKGLKSDEEGSGSSDTNESETSPKKAGGKNGPNKSNPSSASPSKSYKEASVSESLSPKKSENNDRKRKHKGDDSEKKPKILRTKFENCEDDRRDPYLPPVKEKLPDVFAGVRMNLPTNILNCSTLRRYFVAFGGEIVDEYDKSATHSLVSTTDREKNSSSETVTLEWLWDSIKLKELQPTRYYRN
ncbi:UNVERIFIED_CONTAM: hypothetical protein RMT77_008426 [Armadillidium vulgare]